MIPKSRLTAPFFGVDVEPIAPGGQGSGESLPQGGAGAGPQQQVPAGVAAAMVLTLKAGIAAMRRYHRHDVTLTRCRIDEPVLFVANHGFGGIFDPNVLATMAALDDLRLSRPVTTLTHQMAWTFGVGRLLETVGAVPASRQSALGAFARGNHVLVAPGGDVENAKSFRDRNKIVFSGRRGFARLAGEVGVPIVPIVTAGAGESLFVISDGQLIARALRLDRMLRMKAVPISVSVPWGFNVGLVGLFLPYLPLPVKLCTRVLDPMRQEEAETAEEFGDRVEAAMQAALTDMTRNRIPLLG